MGRSIKLVIEEGKLTVTHCEDGTNLGEFTIDELAELIEFRYATPWNKSKDILEKLVLILGDIKNAYERSDEPYPKKEKILKEIKIRLQKQ
ncbi:hypothetical protein [Thermococcus sp. 21S7]|uniref:hypothetical protein n=1 Tax=Thermococcus sp. 21S7 TaxID=1638221 RepID=UPI001F0E5F2F|nr:hypothetical protein [Thermococcus sp. 21S7]